MGDCKKGNGKSVLEWETARKTMANHLCLSVALKAPCVRTPWDCHELVVTFHHAF